MSNFIKQNKINILIIFIFLLLPFIFFKDSFRISNIILGSGDPTAIAVPMYRLVIDSIKNLEFPFWNYYNFSGYPLLSYIESSVFYPITFLFNFFLPATLAYSLSILLHYSLSGIFLYMFLDSYKLSKWASFTGSLIFMFSGAMISQRSHPWQLYTMVWFPLILFFLEKFRRTKRFEFVLAASIFYSICFFGGSPQIFLYGSMVLLFYIIFYSLIYEGYKNYYFLLSFAIFPIVLSIILAQLVPTLELMNLSIRSGIDYNYFSSFSFNPRLFPVLIFPYIFGNSFYTYGDVPAYFGPWNYTEMTIYFGISTSIFLLFGFFVKNKHKYLWIFLLVFSLILVLGSHTPFYRLMYHVPLYNKFRVPARNWFEFSLAFSILCGFGFDYFIKYNNKKSKKIIIGLITLFILILICFFAFYLLIKVNY